MATREKLLLNVAVAESTLQRARSALVEFDANPPTGTLLDFGGAWAIRQYNNPAGAGPGWRTIFGDGSGSFYPDSKGGLSRFWLDDPKEVYRP